MYYDDIEYAQRRLSSTLVRKKNGEPFFISAVVRKGSDTICVGFNPKSEEQHINLKDIDLTPVPLGFANLGNVMAYLCRKPMRKDWKQGLSVNSLVSYGLDKRDFHLLQICDTVLGKYPTLQEAKDFVSVRINNSKAFSRDFGLINNGKNIALMYRKYTVGKLVGGKLVLDADKFFLEQHLAESVG